MVWQTVLMLTVIDSVLSTSNCAGFRLVNRDIDVQAQFSVNQCRPEEITMREDLGSITMMGEDGFGRIFVLCSVCYFSWLWTCIVT